MYSQIPWMWDIKDYYYIGAQPNLTVVMNIHLPWMKDIKDNKYIGAQPMLAVVMYTHMDIKDYLYVHS